MSCRRLPGATAGLLLGLREVVAQTLVFSYLLVAWYRYPRRAWGVVMSILVALALLMSSPAPLVPQPVTP